MRCEIICEDCEKKIGTTEIKVVLSGDQGIFRADPDTLLYFKGVHDARCEGTPKE